jgi:hypothetical protein
MSYIPREQIDGKGLRAAWRGDAIDAVVLGGEVAGSGDRQKNNRGWSANGNLESFGQYRENF